MIYFAARPTFVGEITHECVPHKVVLEKVKLPQQHVDPLNCRGHRQPPKRAFVLEKCPSHPNKLYITLYNQVFLNP
jgi:hypothetical protein